MDEITRRLRNQFGGGDGDTPWPMIRLAVAVILGLWVMFTSVHAIGPRERGVVTIFGAYSRTLNSGIGLTLPAPIERVTKLNVAEIRTIDIPAGGGVENFVAVDVLQDPDIRQGIKAYSDWPTIPQLYVKGEFVGGSDIMMEMYQAGELQQVLSAQ